jgi:hypothetical protein
MSNGRWADPVSKRETLCQNLIHNKGIVGGSTSLQRAFAPHERFPIPRLDSYSKAPYTMTTADFRTTAVRGGRGVLR